MAAGGSIAIHDIGELVTLAPLAQKSSPVQVGEADLGRLHGAWLAIKDGKIEACGEGALPAGFAAYDAFDAKGRLVMPGLIDCHTHPIFGGTRSHEFAAKLRGASYQEIARQGGGIKSTVKATRGASDEELLLRVNAVLGRFLAHGVTTVEVKSGYGLSVREELRLLELLAVARRHTPQHLAVTCLALHALPEEHAAVDAFVKIMTTELLPEVKARHLADWVDAFVEQGYFSVADTEPFIERAVQLGLGIRLHADEFSDAGAAFASARWGAASADHLECTPVNAMQAMAKAGTVAVLLPGTSMVSRLPFTKARPFCEAAVPVAIASDFNPGSCHLKNLPMIAAVAGIQCGLRLPELIAAVTYVPACALRINQSKGALLPGYDGDLLIAEQGSLEEWVYDFGETLPRRVFIGGIPVAEN